MWVVCFRIHRYSKTEFLQYFTTDRVASYFWKNFQHFPCSSGLMNIGSQTTKMKRFLIAFRRAIKTISLFFKKTLILLTPSEGAQNFACPEPYLQLIQFLATQNQNNSLEQPLCLEKNRRLRFCICSFFSQTIYKGKEFLKGETLRLNVGHYYVHWTNFIIDKGLEKLLHFTVSLKTKPPFGITQL